MRSRSFGAVLPAASPHRSGYRRCGRIARLPPEMAFESTEETAVGGRAERELRSLRGPLRTQTAPEADLRSELGFAASAPRSLELADWIYAAGLEGRGWHDVTRVLAAALGATRCWLISTDSGRARIVAASDLPVAAGALGSGSEWAGDAPRDASVEIGGDEALRLVFERKPFAAEERDFVRMIGHHVVRSRLLARALARAEARGHLASAALDRMAMGVVILDGEGRVAHLNPTARRRLGPECGVHLLADRLEFVDPTLEPRLRKLRERERDSTTEPRRLASELLRLPRAGERPPLDILAVSLDGLDLAQGGAAMALFLSDVDHAAETPASVLLRLYGLTPAEARVAGEVLRGSGIDEAAHRLGLKRETIRTHLKHIFAKVGTTRQADLVRLLLTGAAGVRWE
jgi:DNA-binding CsgD family transcriptional regulator/PAS domain-containing protein